MRLIHSGILILGLAAMKVHAVDTLTTPLKSISYGRLEGLSMTRDEKHLVTLSSTGSAYIWSAAAEKVTAAIQSERGPIIKFRIAADDSTLVTGLEDSTLDFWNLRSGSHRGPFDTGKIELGSFWNGREGRMYFPDGSKFATYETGGIKITDAKTYLSYFVFRSNSAKHPKFTSSAVIAGFSPDGRELLLSQKGYLASFLVADNVGDSILQDYTADSPRPDLYAYGYSPDGRKLLCQGTQSRTDSVQNLFILDTGTGDTLQTLRIKPYRTIIGYTGQGNYILAVHPKMNAELLEAGTGLPAKTFRGHTSAFKGLSISPDGTRIVTTDGARYGGAKIFDTESGEQIAEFGADTALIYDVAFSPEGDEIATVTSDGSVKLWDAKSFVPRVIHQVASGHAWNLAYSPNGSKLAFETDFQMMVWDRLTGATKTLRNVDFRGSVSLMAFSPSGDTLAFLEHRTKSGLDQFDYIQFARVSTGDSLPAIYEDYCRALAFSPDGRTFATQQNIYSVGDFKILKPLPGGASVSYSPGGKYLSANTFNATVLYDARTVEAKRAYRIRAPNKSTSRAHYPAPIYSKDGTKLFTTMGHGIQVWDLGDARDATGIRPQPGRAMRNLVVDAADASPISLTIPLTSTALSLAVYKSDGSEVFVMDFKYEDAGRPSSMRIPAKLAAGRYAVKVRADARIVGQALMTVSR